MIELPERAVEALKRLTRMSEAFKSTIRTQDECRDPSSQQDQATAILSARAIRLGDALSLLAAGGYGEATAATTRAMYETQLFMRWVLKDRANAERFFEMALPQGAKIATAILKHSGLREVIGNDKVAEIERLVGASPTGQRLPRFDLIAEKVDFADLHNLIYPALSAMVHPNFLGLGDALVSRQISFNPSADNIDGLLGLAAFVFQDCLRVYHVWMGERRLADAPGFPIME